MLYIKICKYVIISIYLYIYVPIVSITEKPNQKHKISKTQSGHRNTALHLSLSLYLGK